MMRGTILITILTFLFGNFLNAQTVVDALPKFPISPLSADDITKLCNEDSATTWHELSKKAKTSALDLVVKQLYDESAGWLYVYLIAEMFAGNGADLTSDVKKIILSDVPAFCDFYETIKKEDNIKNACAVLNEIYKVYPVNFKKYLRSAYAVSLIYDIPPPASWPVCNTPSDPVAISQPQEVFNIFIENPTTFVFPMDRLTVGELIWIFGVPGPIDELRSLKRPNVAPYAIEKMITSIKTDQSRIDKKTELEWPVNDRPFTPENILKFGGVEHEKVYYSWRMANANGIPCLYFTDKSGSKIVSWLAYMSRPGVWKFDIDRPSTAKLLYGRPLNPQTWKPVEMFDIDMLIRRYVTTQHGVNSFVFLRISELLYEKAEYYNAANFAEKAKKENSENWKAYPAYIAARARFGAPEGELDALWHKAYEAFRRYPDMCVKVLNMYRDNLIALRKGKEADRLLIAEMRTVMRIDPGLAIEIYANQITDMFNRLEDKNEIFAPYQDILRNSSTCQQQCFSKIVSPLSRMFYANEDTRGALRVLSMFDTATGQDPSFKTKTQNIRDSFTVSKGSKRKSE